MNIRLAVGFLLPLLVLLVGFDVPIGDREETARPADSGERVSGVNVPSPVADHPYWDDALRDLPQPPPDPCLSATFSDWREFSLEEVKNTPHKDVAAVRIIVDREAFLLILLAVLPDGSIREIYQTQVAVGDMDTPTPEGRFLINHIYCYPDVVFYDLNRDRIPVLYKGFLAPLLACDENGRCERFRELGIHGFDPSVFAEADHLVPETSGAVTSGCVRIPDPCGFKAALIPVVGIGPLKRNDRGCYHWLDRPVEVWIVDDEPAVVTAFRRGFRQMGKSLKNLFGILIH